MRRNCRPTATSAVMGFSIFLGAAATSGAYTQLTQTASGIFSGRIAVSDLGRAPGEAQVRSGYFRMDPRFTADGARRVIPLDSQGKPTGETPIVVPKEALTDAQASKSIGPNSFLANEKDSKKGLACPPEKIDQALPHLPQASAPSTPSLPTPAPIPSPESSSPATTPPSSPPVVSTPPVSESPIAGTTPAVPSTPSEPPRPLPPLPPQSSYNPPPIAAGSLPPSRLFPNIRTRIEDAERERLVSDTQNIAREFESRAAEDLRILTNEFRKLPIAEKREGIARAAQTLRKQQEHFDQADRSTMKPGERLRFRNLLSTASDKAQQALSVEAFESAIPSLAQQSLPTPSSAALSANSTQAASISAPVAPLAQTQAVSPDALTDRMVLLNALPTAKRQQILKTLKLVETPSLKLKSGETVQIAVPHNGYWLGGSKTGTDCSGLASAALPADVRKLRFTTLDFRALYQISRTGKYTPPPEFEAERLETLTDLSKQFQAIQLQLGDPLKPFDLLVYRLADEPTGHVFIVEKYDPVQMEAQVIEASQSYGGIRSRSFNLSAEPFDAPRRYLRPGLFALRLSNESIARRCILAKKSGSPSPSKSGKTS